MSQNRMISNRTIKTRSFLQLSVVLALAFGAGACQTIADLDPTGLLSDDKSTPDSQFPGGDAAPTASDATQGTTPDLASIPAAPTATAAADQQQTAQSLAADGAQARYSADALRGGTEAAAPVPGAPDAAPLPQLASNAPPSAQMAPMAEAAPTADSAPPSAEAPPTAGPAPAGPSGAMPAVAGAAPPQRPVQVASAAPPPQSMSSAPMAAPAPSTMVPGAEPAVPPNTRIRGESPVTSDVALGFQPSSAPPLDPSINQWVPAPIVAHYRQTASNAGVATSNPMAAVPAVSSARGGMGGPESMSGAVVANLGAIPSGPASVAAGGTAPTAVIFFPGDGVKLSAAARAEIRGAVQAFKAGGGAGSIKVIGHASSRTANMPVEKHLELIFSKSQERANAVAQEIIHEGIPADKVLVEAVGDSQPVYYESMPKGEDGNRRAEIFVQS